MLEYWNRKIINFLLETNRKLMMLGVSILKHFRVERQWKIYVLTTYECTRFIRRIRVKNYPAAAYSSLYFGYMRRKFPTNFKFWLKVRQGATVFADGVCGSCVDIFSLATHLFFSTPPPPRETAQYRHVA